MFPYKGDPWMGTVDDMTCPLQLDISRSSANRMASGRTMDEAAWWVSGVEE